MMSTSCPAGPTVIVLNTSVEPIPSINVNGAVGLLVRNVTGATVVNVPLQLPGGTLENVAPAHSCALIVADLDVGSAGAGVTVGSCWNPRRRIGGGAVIV